MFQKGKGKKEKKNNRIIMKEDDSHCQVGRVVHVAVESTTFG